MKKQGNKRKSAPDESTWSHLDQLLTPVQMMSESDLQKELDYYAGTTFRYPLEGSYLEQRQQTMPPAQYQAKSNIDHLNSLSMLFDRPSTSSEAPVLLNHENVYSNHSTPNHSTPTSPNQTYFDPSKNYLSSTVSDLRVGQDKKKKKQPVRVKKDKKHPLDHLILSRHNKEHAKKKISDDEEEEEEPVIGDGAQSYSSMGSNSSRTSLTKDDKRRRNTAASAQQALQSTACEMTDKAKMMEQRVHDLEREIKWLKALVVEKNDTRLEQLVRERPAASIAFPLYQSSNEEEDENYQY
ncbi:uncharacterized protein EV154DRAFT_521029 [Mucor mucedo]|uniref:uncharacterized protein n=1 Tax=Mucor mucedo TaxID=29922 RepID=UPI00221ED637|nr:uncharacterized protein EV154DRAFT_521029 [Mucor mucedo]KAI7886868.1 hypothetical protein EV154DRAFT_521029 [Mucor mucedo]